MDSILTSIKKLLGIAEEYAHFDADLIIHINSAFMVLNQIGIGPFECFSISSDEESWTDFLDESKALEAVKTYVYLKVKILFDPPANSSALESLNRLIQEYEWRLYTQAETEV